jgi:hypothetical protein
MNKETESDDNSHDIGEMDKINERSVDLII